MSALGERVVIGLASVAISSALLWYLGSGTLTEQLRGGVGEVVERGEVRELAAELRSEQGVGRERALEIARERLEADEGTDSEGAPPGGGGESPGEVRRSLIGGIAAGLWGVLAVPLGLCAVLGLALLSTRAWHRYARRHYVRLLLRPYRIEEASPGRVQRLYEAWHQTVLRRWWERLLFGQPSLGLELSAVPDRAGGVLLRFTLVVERHEVDAISSRLAGTYQHIEVSEASGAPPWRRQILRLKKRYRFAPKRLLTRERERNPSAPGEAMIDDLVIQMQQLGSPATLQITLVPAPALFDQLMRAMIHSSEAAVSEADPRGRSELDDREHEGAAESLAYRAPFFCEIRIAADELPVASALARTIRGGTRGENHLVERRMIVRRRLYAARLAAGVANPLPSFRVGVCSSAELSSLWAMPNSHLVEAPVERHSVPRVSAPPQVRTAPPELALGRDPSGRPIGLLPEDRFHNMAFVGAQGTGKTSGMLAWAREPLASEDHAVIVLDPKSDLALKALSIVPESRRAHYVDFGRPEAGFDIFHRAASTPVDAVVDGIISGFTESTRTEQGESQVLASSVRFFQASLTAALLCYASPNLWDAWSLLMPGSRGDRERARVASELLRHPDFAAARIFFEQQWPEQMKATRVAFTAKLDPPLNKIQSVLNSPALDRVLRHPHKVDIDRVLENREVLVVNGAVGAVGEDNSRTALVWLLTMIHRALQRQQSKPELERAKLALVVDEARMVATPTFEQMLSMDRSAGIEVASAWQFSEQIRDRRVRAGMVALHRNMATFAVGQEDARELSDLYSISHDDSLSGQPAERERHPYAPDALTNIPVHHAAAKLLVHGSKVAPFTYETPPMREDPERIEHHLERQRRDGGHYPEAWTVPAGFDTGPRLASDPWAEEGPGDRIDAPPGAPSGGGAVAGGNGDDPERADDDTTMPAGQRTAEIPEPVGAGVAATSADVTEGERETDGGVTGRVRPLIPREPGAARVGSREGGGEVADGALLGSATEHTPGELLTSLDRLEAATRVSEVPPRGEGGEMRVDRLVYEVLAGLYELRFLTSEQIGLRYMAEKSERTRRARLAAMHRAGFVRRMKVDVRGLSGPRPSIFSITRKGFELAREKVSPRRGTYIPRSAIFRDSEAENAQVIIHDLHAASWLFGLEDLAPEVVEDWYGPQRGRIECPRRGRPGERRAIGASEIEGFPRGQSAVGLALEEFANVVPDVTVEVEAAGRRNDLLVELDRSRRGVKDNNRKKLRRYDALLTGWWRMVERYAERGKPPLLVVCCTSEEQARAFVEVADELMTGAVHREGIPPTEWYYLGRWSTFFAVTRDVHQRTTRAYQLPKHPPELRRAIARNALERNAARRAEPRQSAFIPRRFLRRPAR